MNKKIGYEEKYRETVSHDCGLLDQLINDVNLQPTIKWYRGFCEVSFTLNVDKKEYERHRKGKSDVQH